MSANQPDMPASEVVKLEILFDQQRIEVILDGGWAVDALLERQTRPHSDLDIAMPHEYVPVLRKVLEDLGYCEVPRDDTRECNFVLADGQGHQVDVHTYTYDGQGKLVFGLPYPLDSLTGHGRILGHALSCITPEWLVRFHTGYALDENDYHDVNLLCERFGLELPKEYKRFTMGG